MLKLDGRTVHKSFCYFFVNENLLNALPGVQVRNADKRNQTTLSVLKNRHLSPFVVPTSV